MSLSLQFATTAKGDASVAAADKSATSAERKIRFNWMLEGFLSLAKTACRRVVRVPSSQVDKG